MADRISSRSNDVNTDVFERLPVPQAVLTMGIPTILGQMVILIYSMADTFFVGRTNNPYMVAGASLILPLFNIAPSIASIAGVGGGTMISRLLGKHDTVEAERVSRFCVWLSGGAALLFSLLIALFMNPILHFLGAGEATYDFAASYTFFVIVIGGLPTVLSNVLSNLLRSTGESKKAGFGIMMGGIINIALDPLFMFVLFPKGMEIAGAGAATCLSNMISCCYFILTIRKLQPQTVLRMGMSRILPKASSVKLIFVVGFPSALATFLFDLDYMVIDRLMAGYHDIALAAIGIVLKAERLPLNVGIGICQGMVPIIAYNYSSGDHKRMRDTIRFSRRLGIVCALVSISLYELFAPYIMRVFIADAQTVALGTNFLRIRCIATILMFLSFFHVHLFNSFGRGREALFLGVVRWAVYNIPMLFLLNWLWGMYGIVWAQFLADILTVSTSVYVYQRYMKKSGLN